MSKTQRCLYLNVTITIAEGYMENVCLVQEALKAKAFDRSNLFQYLGLNF